MKAKRAPLLADRFLAAKPLPEDFMPWRVQHRVRMHLVDAKRFIFDERAASYVGDFIDKMPEAIAYAQEFAIPAFPTMYLELPIRPLWEAVNRGRPPDPTSDTRVGYLIHGPRAYTLFEASEDYPGRTAGRGFGMSPIMYLLHQPLTPEQQQQVFANDPEASTQKVMDAADFFFWGSASLEKLPPDAVRQLRAEHGVAMIGGRMFADVEKLGPLMFGSAGDLRTLIALLLFLNQPSKLRIEYTDVEPVRGMIGNKSSTYLRHSIVRLPLDPLPRLKRLYGNAQATGAFRREHDVRGHFCHDERARAHCNAIHDWTETGVQQWRCLKCGGLRWWKRAHRRGTRDKGRVSTSYQVVASHEHVQAHQP